ncbi:hypothetical protein GCM10025858_03000 [Alicyclobacillus sacchari]|uniref:spermidine synthase n=1 Tax=Alicyclobacillus sacchari TaxID=392010 RepID=UPI0023EA29C6|nr:spermidine synthase [Alicyclobacillus sacchari]GMA55797.1 hypothetical protein GCM10025858_03000 [Alicyclobacillus sacchari]
MARGGRSRPARTVFPYQRAFRALVQAQPQLSSFLSIGVGAGTSLYHVRKIHPKCLLHGVEIDETVLGLGMEYFQAPTHKEADYWVGDGFAFIRSEMAGRYDLVFVDAYLKTRIYQPALASEVWDWLLAVLQPSGMIVYNIIASHYRSGQLRTFVEACRERFASVVDLPVGVPWTSQNRLLIASNRPHCASELKDALMHTDAAFVERSLWSARLRDIRGTML